MAPLFLKSRDFTPRLAKYISTERAYTQMVVLQVMYSRAVQSGQVVDPAEYTLGYDWAPNELDMRGALNLFVDLAVHRRINLNMCSKHAGASRAGVGVADGVGGAVPKEVMAVAAVVAACAANGVLDRELLRRKCRDASGVSLAEYATAQGVFPIFSHHLLPAGGLVSLEQSVEVAAPAGARRQRPRVELRLIEISDHAPEQLSVPKRGGWPAVPGAVLRPLAEWTNQELADQVRRAVMGKWPLCPLLAGAGVDVVPQDGAQPALEAPQPNALAPVPTG